MKRMGMLILGMSILLTGCERSELDRQMEVLCKKDGGVQVYEIVKLPSEMFDQDGDPFPGWGGRIPEERLGKDYSYEFQETILKAGDPLKGEGRLDRMTFRIYRRSDKKLLGEEILYGRSGGDYIAYAHPSSKSCPSGINRANLIQSVFIK